MNLETTKQILACAAKGTSHGWQDDFRCHILEKLGILGSLLGGVERTETHLVVWRERTKLIRERTRSGPP
jgi:hypothetical protein